MSIQEKPRITHTYNLMRCWYYICRVSSDPYFKIGVGATQLDAYNDWLSKRSLRKPRSFKAPVLVLIK